MRFKPRASIKRGFLGRIGEGERIAGTLAPNPIVFDERNTPRRFDEIIKDFAIIAVSASGNPPLPAPGSKLVETLGARRVRLCSGEFIPLSQVGAETVADTRGVFARDLRLTGDQYVLVRPDRIIAGACAPDVWPQLEDALTRQLA